MAKGLSFVVAAIVIAGLDSNTVEERDQEGYRVMMGEQYDASGQYIRLDSGQQCENEGHSTITTREDCRAAALAIDESSFASSPCCSGTAGVSNWGNIQVGCFVEPPHKAQHLYFNTNAAGTVSPTYQSLCVKAPPPPSPAPTPPAWPRNSAHCDVSSTAFTDCLSGADNPLADGCSHGAGHNSPDRIPDSAITASSTKTAWTTCDLNDDGTRDGTYDKQCNTTWSQPYHARLNDPGPSWFPETDLPSEYIQFDLGEVRLITGMKTQGAPSTSGADRIGPCMGPGPDGERSVRHKDRVFNYQECSFANMQKIAVQYSYGNEAWINLSPGQGEDMTVMPGPVAGDLTNQEKEYRFPYQLSKAVNLAPFEARYIRIWLRKKSSWGISSIRADFFGPQCQMTPQVPVGVGSFAIPDAAFTENMDYAHVLYIGEGAAQGRLNNAGGYWRTLTYNGELADTGPWLQVDIGQAVSIGAMATQGMTNEARDYVATYKLGGSLDGVTFTMQSDVHTGNTGGPTDVVVKNYVTPFHARFVRIQVKPPTNVHPSMRFELYAAATSFDWSPLALDTQSASLGDVGSTIFCNKTMVDLQASFSKWTLGLSGDSTIYVSESHTATYNDIEYLLRAYQRRRCVFTGLMVKSVVCVTDPSDGKDRCCVAKKSSLLGRGPWHEQDAETKLA